MNRETSMKQRDYWPTEKWKKSTPEKQGMSSEKIYNLFRHIIDNNIGINSLVIIRNGYKVTEGYFHPHNKDYTQSIHSITKPIVAALIGIAMKEGYINNVNQKIIDFFPDKKIENLCERKREMNLHHALLNATGLEWGDVINKSEAYEDIRLLLEMTQFDDWGKFVFDRVVEHEPGTFLTSNSLGPQLLETVLRTTTGRNVPEYAEEKLFKPMGISKYTWWASATGECTGGQGLILKTEDLAKFGFLYLNYGWWDGKSIVPSEWIARATSPISNTRENFKELDKYGYLWFVSSYIPHKNYGAYGIFGQYLYIVEDLDLVIAFNGDLPAPEFKEIIFNFIRNDIVPACISKESLPDDVDSFKKLESLLNVIENPEPSLFQDFPVITEKISGKTYVFDNKNSIQFFSDLFNTYILRKMSLNFKKNKECEMQVLCKDYEFTFPIGLNGLYKTVEVQGRFGKMNISAKGYWEKNKFIINYRTNLNRKHTFSISFEENKKEVVCFSDTFIFSGEIIGREVETDIS